jgi:hypothetical protein
MEIPTGEKQTAHVTTEEHVRENGGDPYGRETDSACNNRENR